MWCVRGLRDTGVLGNGSYVLCGIGQTVPELAFGHAARDALAAVWHNTPTLCALRENPPRRPEGICADNLMKRHCLGSCVAQNCYRSKNLLAPFWFCEAAREKGLFPESRLAARPPKLTPATHQRRYPPKGGLVRWLD